MTAESKFHHHININCCNIWNKFQSEKNLIKEYTHWILVVRPKQVKLGACVAITKRHIEKMSDVTPDEMKEYSKVAKGIESALKTAFDYTAIHHMVMMFKDKHIHFHIFPRYDSNREFAGIEWVDDFNPDPFIQKVESSPRKILDEVKAKLTENIPQDT